MKQHFVKTENHKCLMAAVSFMEERGSPSACLCLLHGEPGVGKTRNISHWGAASGAVLVKGHVGMNLDGLIWSISQQLGLKHKNNRSAELADQIAALKESRSPIVFDEAQFGLSMRWQRTDAAGIEYLRTLGESANTFILLVCHNSEKARFSDSAHIRTRISHQAEMHNAGLADTVAFVRELTEVTVGDGVGEQVHKQTGGKFRLIENAISTLERIAKQKGATRIDTDDIRGITLVIDHEQGLIPKIAPKTLRGAR